MSVDAAAVAAARLVILRAIKEKGYNHVLAAAQQFSGSEHVDIAAETGDVCTQIAEPREDRWFDAEELVKFAAYLALPPTP